MKMNLLTFRTYQLFHSVTSNLSFFPDHGVINANPPQSYSTTSLSLSACFFNFFLYSNLKLTGSRCHAEPKAKHLCSGLIVRSPDSSLHCVSLRMTRCRILLNLNDLQLLLHL